MAVAWQRALSIAVMAVGCASDPPSLPGGTGVGSGTDGTATTDDGGDGGPGSGGDAMSSGDASATTTTDPPGGTDDTTGSVPLTCGDATVQPEEDCDDGNDDELDGCTSSCQIGPVGLEWSEPLQDSEVVVWWNSDGLDVVSDCPPGQVLNRIEVLAGSIIGNGQDAVSGFVGHCSAAALADANPTSIVLANASSLPKVGTPLNAAGDLACSGGLTGFAARVEQNTATAVAATCRDFEVTVTDGMQSLGLGPAVNLPPIVGDALVPGQATQCPDGQVAVGLRSVLLEGIPGSLGLRCREASLVYP